MTKDDESRLESGMRLGRALRVRARLRELERRRPAQRFRLRLLEWAYLPLLAATLVVMVVGLVLGIGDARGEAGGVLLLAGGLAGVVRLIQRTNDEISDLEEEGEALSRELASATDVPGSAPSIPPPP